MTAKEALLKELEGAPEPVLKEVLSYLALLKAKTIPAGLQTAFASETALAKDWGRPEEDEAWKDL